MLCSNKRNPYLALDLEFSASSKISVFAIVFPLPGPNRG
jgi:hypothetical protein